jgi:hypothetical protein
MRKNSKASGCLALASKYWAMTGLAVAVALSLGIGAEFIAVTL